MSYILEALEEAQKSRDDAKVPNLRSVHVEPKTSNHVGNRRLAYLTAVGVLMTASLATFWWMKGSEPSLDLDPSPSSSALPETPSAESAAVVDARVPPGVETYETTIKDSVVELPRENIAVSDGGDIDTSVASAQAESVPAPEAPPVMVEEVPPVDQSTVTNSQPRSEPVISSVHSVSENQQAKVAETELVAAPATSPPFEQAAKAVINEVSAPGMQASEPQPSPAEARSATDELATEKLPSEQVARVVAPPPVQAIAPLVEARRQPAGSVENREEEIQESAPPPVPHFRELPFDVQQSLPAISYSVHLYSAEPAHRMVKIDGRVRREGDTVKPGLVLKEITPSGAIFSFRDKVFRVPVNG